MTTVYEGGVKISKATFYGGYSITRVSGFKGL